MSVSATLSDGSSVIVFSTLQGVYYERFDAGFHSLAGPTLVSSGPSPWVSVLPLAGGGFGVQWDSGATAANPIGLSEIDYSNAGVQTGSSHPATPTYALLDYTSD